MRVSAATVVTAVLTGAFVVAGAGNASAHDALLGSDPAPGATVDAVPDRVTLRFAEPAQALGTQVAVLGPAGNVTAGRPVLAGSTVAVAVEPGAPAGAYRVSYRVTSADGHQVQGSWRFTATGAAPSGPTPDPTLTPIPPSAPPPTAPPPTQPPTAEPTRAPSPVETGTPAESPASADSAASRTVPVLVVLGVLVVGAVVATVLGRRWGR